MALLKTNTGIGTTNPTSSLHVIGDGLFTGVVTATSFSGSENGTISAGVATFTDLTATRLSVLGVSTFIGGITGTISTATKLETARTFEITGDVVASPITFDGTGNVSLAATIQPNSVELGTDTFGDYVESISGTANEIDVTGGTGEGSTPVISFAPNPLIGGNVTIGNDLQVNNNLNVTGNITVGGTSGYILVNEFRVTDADIVLGFTTDISGNDVSNDTTANHGGIAIASTEGNPLITLTNPGVGETLPATYKKFMWFKAGSFAGLNTDAWLSNYAIGIGSTQFPSGTRLAAGSVQITENDLAVVRNINASGIVTAPTFVGNLTGTATTASNLTRSVIAGDGLTGGGELTADRTLNIGVGTGITVNSDDIQLRNSDNLTNNTITKWDDGNGQLTDSLITDDGSIVNVGSAITFYASSGIISATAYFGSGGNLEDIIKEKLEGFTAAFKPYDSTKIILGTELRTVNLEIFDNSTVGLITAVGVGSTARYFFNDVTAVGLTTDANVNTTGVITSRLFVGDGSGLTGLAGVAAGVTVYNNGITVGTASVLNFGPDIDVTQISSGIVTFSLNGNQNFAGIVTASTLDVGGNVDITGNTSIGGSVGIGITNPLVALDVSGDALVSGRIGVGTTTATNIIHAYATTNYTDIRLSNNVNDAYFGISNTPLDSALPQGHAFIYNANGGISLYAQQGYINLSTGSNQQRVRITNAGDVGIGTTIPSQKLDVNGNVRFRGALYDFNNATGNPGELLTTTGTGVSWTTSTTTPAGRSVISASADTPYYITASSVISGVSSVAYIDSDIVIKDGNVGIATTNPTSRLHIIGDALVVGVVTATTFSGNATSATYASNAGIATYATAAGIATYATAAGIATYATAAGIATYATAAGAATTATNIDISATSSGDTTAYVVLVGNNVTGGQQPFIDNGSLTYNASTNVLTAGGGFSGDGSALTSLNGSQITSGTIPGDRGVTSGSTSSSFIEYNGTTATSGQFDGGTTNPSSTTRLNYGGYLYATRFYGDGSNLTAINYANSAGVSTNVIGGIASVTQLSVSGVSTLGTVQISSGIVTATTGIVTYYGDGSNLSNLPTTPAAGSSGQVQYNNGGAFGGASALYYDDVNNRVGVGTTNPQTTLHVVDEFLLSTAGAASTQRISQKAYTTENGTLSWEGTAGQLFSITNNLTSGSIFSVNDVSGIPSIDVNADGTIQLAPYADGNVGIATTRPTSRLHVVGNALITGVVTATTFSGNATSATYATIAGVSTNVIGGIASVTQLSVSGISTFTNGPVLIGTGTSTGTASQRLQVTGGAYVSGSIGIGTTNPQYKLHVVGDFGATTKSFVIPHPSKPGMKLRYGSLESPYHGIRLTGSSVIEDGLCVVNLPDYICDLVSEEGVNINITNIKHGKVIWVEEVNIQENKFIVMTEEKVGEYAFYWDFTAIRKDVSNLVTEY